jgi:lysozyme
MTDDEFLDMLVHEEGKVPYAYQDHLGFWTIGVGRLIDKRKGGRLSEDEIMYLLNNDVTRFVMEVQAALPWVKDLSVTRQQVLVAMAFQLGTKGLLGFKNTLDLVRTGQYERAAKGMLNSKWAKQDSPARAKRMAELMRLG